MAIQHSQDGAWTWADITAAVARWEEHLCAPGKYRVTFCIPDDWSAAGLINADAVVDDFGNLVRV